MMQLRNIENRYGAISIALHWLGALAVTVMLSSGLMMANADSRDVYLSWVRFHSSSGILLLLLLAARIAWHFVERQPAKLSENRALNRVATAVHAVLLILIAAQLVTGPLDIWSGGFPLRVFDWFTLASPIGDALNAQHDAIGTFHGYVGLVIGVLVALHIAAVFKHLLGDGDDTLARMIGMADEPAKPVSTPQSDRDDPGIQMP